MKKQKKNGKMIVGGIEHGGDDCFRLQRDKAEQTKKALVKDALY